MAFSGAARLERGHRGLQGTVPSLYNVAYFIDVGGYSPVTACAVQHEPGGAWHRRSRGRSLLAMTVHFRA
jgi:hypothetical protein